MKELVIILFLLILSAGAFAADLDQSMPKPIVSIPFIDKPTTVDGNVTDEEYKWAAVFDGFKRLSVNTAPEDKTRAYAYYDNEKLYIGVMCFSKKGKVLKSDAKKHDDNVFMDDALELYFSPNRSGREYHFIGNSIGTKYDARDIASSYNPDWDYAAKLTDYGWSCEFAIPFKAFEVGTPKPEDYWGLLIGRTIQNPETYYEWGNCDVYWHEPAKYGTIIFNPKTPIVDVYDVEARGLEISAKLKVKSQYDTSVALLCELSQINKNKSNKDVDAVVMVFDDAPASKLLVQESHLITLKPGEEQEIKLPVVPSGTGSYVMRIGGIYPEIPNNKPNMQLFYDLWMPLDKIKPVDIIVRSFPTYNVMEIEVNTKESGLSDKINSYEYILTDKENKVIWKNTTKDTLVKYTNYKGLAYGTYKITINVFDKDKKVILTDNKEFVKSKPAWADKKLGNEDTVIAPWTPVKVSKTKDTINIEVWARKYVFNKNGIPKEVISEGNNLLSSPFNYNMVINGKLAEFVPVSEPIIKKGDAKTEIKFISVNKNDKNVKLEVNTYVEFDGFVWTDVKLIGNKFKLNKFWLEVPIKREFAKYRLPVFNDPTTINNGVFNTCVIPYTDWLNTKQYGLYWVGNEDRGLNIAFENDNNWNYKDELKGFELISDDNISLWRSHIIDVPTNVDRSISWGYCFLATPLKPIVGGFNSARCVGDGWYPNLDIKNAPNPNDTSALADPNWLANKGVKVAHIHEPWTEIMGYPGTFLYDQQIKPQMKKAKDIGFRYALYGHPVLSSIAPEFDEWGNDMAAQLPLSAAFQRNPPQNVYFMCKTKSWNDFFINGWYNLAKDWNVGAMYLDGTYAPGVCRNPYHKHTGYLGKEGNPVFTDKDEVNTYTKVRPDQPIRDARDFMMRYVRTLRTVDPNFYLLGHGTFPFTGHFMNYYMSGENFWTAKTGFEIPMDYMRTVYGKQWGLPNDFYPGPILDHAYMAPIAYAHGIGLWASSSQTDDYKVPTWNVWNNYDINNAKFIPYWKKDLKVTTDNADVVVSYYINKNGILLAPATNKREKPNAIIKVNLKDLGLSENISVKSGNGALIEGCEIKNEILTIPFPIRANIHPLDTYIWIKNN